MSERTFAQARAELWASVARGVSLGLNPPLALRDHETDGYFHALLYVERGEDVWKWACHFGVPVSTDYRRAPLTEPEAHEYPRDPDGPGRRLIEACVLIADDREVTVTYGEDIQDGAR